MIGPGERLGLGTEMVVGTPSLPLCHGHPVKHETVALRRIQLAIHAEIEQRETSVFMKDDIAGVQIGMKQPVRYEHLQ